MHIASQFKWLLAAGAALASGATISSPNCSPNCTLTSGDTQVLQYSWALSQFISNFYASVPVNQSLAYSLSNSTSPLKALANLKGIEKENNLTVVAIRELSSKSPNFTRPKCNYTYPKISSMHSFAKYAYELESTLSGAFIGAAGYTRSPEVSFLMARLAAQHSAHAVWIGSRMSSTFQPNGTSLLPAYTPKHVLMSKNMTGNLGQYLHGCVTAPTQPCGVLKIGPLEANLTSSSAVSSATASKRLI